MDSTTNGYQYLAPKPGSSYRQLYIKDKRVRALTIYQLGHGDEEVRSPEEIAEDFQIPLEAVMEAFAYVESNPPEIALDFAADELLSELSGMNDPNYKYNPKPKILTTDDWNQIERIYDALPRRSDGRSSPDSSTST